MVHMKFGFDWLNGFRVKIFEIVDGRRRSMVIHSYEMSQSVDGRKASTPRKNHLAHRQANLGLSHMWPVRGSNPHQTQRRDDRMGAANTHAYNVMNKLAIYKYNSIYSLSPKICTDIYITLS